MQQQKKEKWDILFVRPPTKKIALHFISYSVSRLELQTIERIYKEIDDHYSLFMHNS